MPKSSSSATSRPSKSRIAGSKRSSSSVAAAASSSTTPAAAAAPSSTSKGKKASSKQSSGVTLEPPQGKQLASTEKVIRDAAIKQLAAFLSQADDGEGGGGGGRLDEAEMRKLWKGLFYCFWMSDKPLVQQGLASELSALVLSIEPVSCESLEDRTLVALDFVAGFWECLVREWAGIDRLRLDKYYMFIRRFTHACFLLLRRASYAPSCVEKFNAILLAGPLSYTRQGVPPSLSWHLADIYLAEFATSLQTPTPPPAGEASEPTTFVPALFEPFVRAGLHTNHATTFKRLVDSALTPLVGALAGEGTGLDGLKALDEGDAVRNAVMQMVWRESGKESCRPEKRRSVLIWWKDQGGGEDDE